MRDDLVDLNKRVDRIRLLAGEEQGSIQWFEAATLAQSVLHDSVGNAHPLATTLRNALDKADFYRAVAGARAVVRLWEEGGLRSPRLAIAHEIEGGLLDIADAQVREAEGTSDASSKQLQLAIAAFLAGAALEDALRRLCDANEVAYDTQRTSLSKLQAALYQPSKQITLITASDNKQITAWGDVRNKADHGQFAKLTFSEVLSMTVGVRGFIDRSLP